MHRAGSLRISTTGTLLLPSPVYDQARTHRDANQHAAIVNQLIGKTGLYAKNICTSTTVFGVDETSRFLPDGSLVDAESSKPIKATERYRSCKPRPIPQCLDELRKVTEVLTCATYNFCLVNYYATGADSISYHSDDERFLGPNPCIASLSLGAQRDFLMKHKPDAAVTSASGARPATQLSSPANAIAQKPLKLTLGSGDMVLMRGPTQANWLHSIPKRKGGEADKGRINITFRKALVRGGTENYYCYNVGNGGVWKWDIAAGEMRPR